MNKKIRYIAFLLAIVAILTVAVSCTDGETEDTEYETAYGEFPEYDLENIDGYVKPFEYKGLTVYAKLGETHQEALWGYIVDSAEIIAYPEAQVEYYARQDMVKYKYLAKRDGISYEDLLEGLGVTEESIYADARALVKSDIVLEYIIKAEGISLSEEEKAKNLDKYASLFAEKYGYDRQDV